MARLATITLYIDPDEYEQEVGKPLDELEVIRIGKIINDEVAAGWIGYSGWHTGWAEYRDDGFVQREFLEAHDIEGAEEIINGVTPTE
jgi:hypothetical protein